MGYRKRTGFLAGLTVAQISEFSLMLGALGKDLGHISGEVLGLITLVGLITITLSTYLILYSHPLYDWLAPFLSWSEKKNPFREVELETTVEPARGFDAIVFGLGRFGNHLSRELTSSAIRNNRNPPADRHKEAQLSPGATVTRAPNQQPHTSTLPTTTSPIMR